MSYHIRYFIINNFKIVPENTTCIENDFDNRLVKYFIILRVWYTMIVYFQLFCQYAFQNIEQSIKLR